MKNLMKILLVICFIAGISTVGKAQMWTPEERAKTLQSVLKLNNEQTAKITTYYVELQKKMQEVVQSGAQDGAMAPVMAATKAKIKAVLTKSQNVAYEKWLIEQAKKDDSSKK